MKLLCRSRVLLTVALVGLVGLFPGIARSQDLSANAALQYWQGFALLPSPNAEQSQTLAAWDRARLDSRMEELVSSAATALEFVHRGAELRLCNWGLNREDGFDPILPHLDKGRLAVQLLGLRGRLAFELGDPTLGLAELRAALTLARHLGADGTLASLQFQATTEEQVADFLGLHFADLSAAARKEFLGQLDTLPAGANLVKALRYEKSLRVDAVVRQLQSWEGERDWRQRLVRLLTGEDQRSEKSRAIIAALNRIDNPTRPRVIRVFNNLQAYYDAVEDALRLPPLQIPGRISKAVDKVKDNPLAEVLLEVSGMKELWEQQAVGRVKMAMLRAILLGEGQASRMRAVRDPFGTGPFSHKVLPGGFELTSKLQVEDKPVKLLVRQDAAN